jgi:hypothetical protein
MIIVLDSLQDLLVGDFVFPVYVLELFKASEMEVVEQVFVSTAPCLDLKASLNRMVRDIT